MRLLLLTQVLPYPPDSGPKVKTWNLVKYLATNHEITLASFTRGEQAREVAVLRRFCREVRTVPIERRGRTEAWALLRSLVTAQPFLMLRDDRRAMRRLVDELARQNQFDVAHADQLNMLQYATRVPRARIVLDAHNALWLVFRRLWQQTDGWMRKLFLAREWRLLRRYEGEACRHCDAVLAVSAPDAGALAEAAGQPVRIFVVPIAIDPEEVQTLQPRPDAARVVHMATLLWPPNADGVVWFLREVWPLIRRRRHDLGFDIVGARPPALLQREAAAAPGVTVHGYVDDPTTILERAGVIVVPLRAGGGMRVKILTALAQGLPVVSTSIGCEGIAVESGVHLLIADGPEEFADATVRLLEDRQLARVLALGGRNLIEQRYDYRRAYRSLDQLYGAGSRGGAANAAP